MSEFHRWHEQRIKDAMNRKKGIRWLVPSAREGWNAAIDAVFEYLDCGNKRGDNCDCDTPSAYVQCYHEIMTDIANEILSFKVEDSHDGDESESENMQ